MTNLNLYSNSFGWQLFPIYFHLKSSKLREFRKKKLEWSDELTFRVHFTLGTRKIKWCRLQFFSAKYAKYRQTCLFSCLGWILFLPPANEVCEGYVFTGVCLSTGGGGGEVLECVTGETATAASGTHPTGMHSCSVMKILYTILDPVEFFTTRRHWCKYEQKGLFQSSYSIQSTFTRQKKMNSLKLNLVFVHFMFTILFQFYTKIICNNWVPQKLDWCKFRLKM